MARRQRPHFLDAAAGRADAFALRATERGALLATHALLAGDSRARRQGLLGRDGLSPGDALVIAPTQGIHTFGMRFPIDVVFADRLGCVVRIADAVPPARVRLAWRGFAAIELPAGTCRAIALRRGDHVEVLPG